MSKPFAFQSVTLCAQIADVIAINVKSYNVPAFCVRMGLQEKVGEGDTDEAHSSKRSYVKALISDLPISTLLDITARIHEEFPDDALADVLSAVKYADLKVSELVRRDVLKVLNSVDGLFGERPLFDVLETIFGSGLFTRSIFGSDNSHSLRGRIEQHYLRNPEDMSSEAMLIECGALSCSQERFFSLLEQVLHPSSRRDQSQEVLANSVSTSLSRSGFSVQVTSSDSGYPIYTVVEIRSKVHGAMKNIIFASVGEKPELVFKDAINNDVEIVKNADNVLIYDRVLPPSGALLWKNLQEWWAEKNGLQADAAKLGMYQRLSTAVKSASSPGEYAIFRTFYSRYPALIGEDKVPALIPQVYLHYDPYTQRQRGDEKYLVRQRMDFLLILEHGVRIVIEVDGRHHYSHLNRSTPEKSVADPARYAEMAAEDRRLKLKGYEVYRFGAGEFADVEMSTWSVGKNSQRLIESFFDQLLKKHRVYSE